MGNEFAALSENTQEMHEMRRGMLRFAMLQLRDEQSAEDAVQDALTAAFVSADRFDGRSSLKTWVFGILRNKIVDIIRSRSRSINVSAFSLEGQSIDEAFDALFKDNAHWAQNSRPRDWGDPEAVLDQQQFWVVFEACMTHLPENTARVFMMREILELDTAEICQELSISTDNCYVILHRARNGLRMCLDKNWFAEGDKTC